MSVGVSMIVAMAVMMMSMIVTMIMIVPMAMPVIMAAAAVWSVLMGMNLAAGRCVHHSIQGCIRAGIQQMTIFAAECRGGTIVKNRL